MLGLLIKDFRLIRNQGINFFIFTAVIGAVLLTSQENSTPFVAYLTILGVFWVLNTISYDSYENGYAFLFTLPVSPGLYVKEKYVLSFLISTVSCLISGCIAESFERGNYKIWEHWAVYLTIWMVMLWITSFLLPLNLKFGADKSRIILIGLWAGILAVAYVIYRVDGAAVQGIAEAVNGLYESLGTAGLCLAGGIVTAAVFLFSMGISIRVMQKKEF